MKTSTRRPRTATINLSDFMRIQNEIIPSKNAIVERKNYDEKLKNASRAHILNFPDSKVKNFNEMIKNLSLFNINNIIKTLIEFCENTKININIILDQFKEEINLNELNLTNITNHLK